MTITKVRIVEKCVARANGHIEIYERDVFMDDGVEIARADGIHMRGIQPSYEGERDVWRDHVFKEDEDPGVKAQAEALWTEQKIADFKVKHASSD